MHERRGRRKEMKGEREKTCLGGLSLLRRGLGLLRRGLGLLRRGLGLLCGGLLRGWKEGGEGGREGG